MDRDIPFTGYLRLIKMTNRFWVTGLYRSCYDKTYITSVSLNCVETIDKDHHTGVLAYTTYRVLYEKFLTKFFVMSS